MLIKNYLSVQKTDFLFFGGVLRIVKHFYSLYKNVSKFSCDVLYGLNICGDINNNCMKPDKVPSFFFQMVTKNPFPQP
ncbi:hypothetical protein PO909_019227 [Leuciscus waleckii]